MRAPPAAVMVGLLAVLLPAPSVLAADAAAPLGNVSRAEKQFDLVQSKLQELLGQEMDVTMALMTAQEKARKVVSSPEEAAKEIAKGHITPELQAYRMVMEECIKRVKAVDRRYVALLKSVTGLKRATGAEAIKPQAEALEEQIRTKHLANLLKIAELQEKAGDFKGAIEIYRAISRAIPASDKQKKRDYKEKIANAYEMSGDLKTALSLFREVYDSIPKEKRAENLSLMLKVAYLHEANRDPQRALEVYKAVQGALAPGQVVSGLDERVKQLEGGGAR